FVRIRLTRAESASCNAVDVRFGADDRPQDLAADRPHRNSDTPVDLRGIAGLRRPRAGHARLHRRLLLDTGLVRRMAPPTDYSVTSRGQHSCSIGNGL